MDCWRVGQVKHEDFLNDINLVNKFISIQKTVNPDFLVEIFLEPTSREIGSHNKLNGTINFIVKNSLVSNQKRSHTGSDVLSLNASLAMTGFCPANQQARANTRFYNSIAISNMMGAWAFLDKGIEQLWWVLPTDWDRLDSKTKKIYIDNYEEGRKEYE